MNDFLLRPLDEEFSLQEDKLEDDLLRRYGSNEIHDAVNNPKDLERLTRFLVLEAQKGVPELKQLRQSLAAQERLLESSRRKRWMPTLNLNAGVKENLDRGGEGADQPWPDDTSWNVNLNVNWELYSGGGIGSEARKSRIERDRLRKQLQQGGRSVEKRLRNALLDLYVQEADLELAEKAAVAAQKTMVWFRIPTSRGPQPLPICWMRRIRRWQLNRLRRRRSMISISPSLRLSTVWGIFP